MQRSDPINAGLLVLSLLLFGGENPPHPGEDVCIAGRSVSDWTTLMNRIEFRDPASRDYVPGLIALMETEDLPAITRRQAALTLGRLGPLAREALPRVVKQLPKVDADDPELSPQRWALSALALFGREAQAATPTLIELLNAPGSSVITRLGCLEALSQIGSASHGAIPGIWDALSDGLSSAAADDQREVAFGAAEALGMIGPDAAPAVPVLMRAAQGTDADIRRESLRALGRIGVAAKDAQPLLLDAMLGEDDPVLRDVAESSLAQTGPAAWPLIEPLFDLDDAEVRERVAAVVATWKPLARMIAPRLEALHADPQPRVRLAACKSHRRLTGDDRRAWQELIRFLTDDDRDIRRGASRELQLLATSRQITVEDIQALLESPESPIRTEGIRLQRLRSAPGK